MWPCCYYVTFKNFSEVPCMLLNFSFPPSITVLDFLNVSG